MPLLGDGRRAGGTVREEGLPPLAGGGNRCRTRTVGRGGGRFCRLPANCLCLAPASTTGGCQHTATTASNKARPSRRGVQHAHAGRARDSQALQRRRCSKVETS